MPRVVVLGCGMVGSFVAVDLASDPALDVTVVDVGEEALGVAARRAGGRLATHRADLSDVAALGKLVEDFDLVVGALPSALGFATLSALIDAGARCCDISFMPEDAWDLDERARDTGALAIVDCGVAPGMSNLLAAAGAASLDRCERLDVMVGGVPKRPEPPFFYKAAFAPSDVIEEYTRPARVVEDGVVVAKEALSETETVELPGVGALEASITDGLRSLVKYLPIAQMRERTLRHPGHYAVARALRDSGLFSKEPVRVRGVDVVPLELTSALLFPRWSYAAGEVDLTVMRVEVEGERGGERVVVRWDLLVEADSSGSSMARATGLACTTFARLVLAGEVTGTGVLPLERLGRDAALVGRVLAMLEARGIRYERSEERR